ncbi:head-tail connector protein [Lactobacillus terrae]|uniref:head-tail connector protein n=1 Tax=Lactobacillus terrae TaxID=2269374 RepID=UPI000C1B6E13|nr:head-tail connector protein [Lactobacillus terrae]
MLLTDVQFETLKNYCKIDQSFDNDVLETIVESGAREISNAIDENKEPEFFIKDKRFLMAVMKYVYTDYYYRGTSSETMQFPITNATVQNVISQLRAEYFEGGDEDENN